MVEPLDPEALVGATIKRVTVLKEDALGKILPGVKLVVIDLGHPTLPDFMMVTPVDMVQLWGPTLEFSPDYVERQVTLHVRAKCECCDGSGWRLATDGSRETEDGVLTVTLRERIEPCPLCNEGASRVKEKPLDLLAYLASRREGTLTPLDDPNSEEDR